MAMALASLYTGRRARADTAMTGEITLAGLVLPVGGIREKVLAARIAPGGEGSVPPRRNAVDLWKLPAHLRDEIESVLADTIEDVLAAVLDAASSPFGRRTATSATRCRAASDERVAVAPLQRAAARALINVTTRSRTVS